MIIDQRNFNHTTILCDAKIDEEGLFCCVERNNDVVILIQNARFVVSFWVRPIGTRKKENNKIKKSDLPDSNK